MLLVLGVGGQAVRHLATRSGEPPGQVQLLATLSPGSPLAHRDSAMRQARPLEPGERLDVDKAPLSELTRLPRIGPRLAKVILAERESNGPFGSLAGLDRVAGVGPGLLKVIEPHVVFSGADGQRGGGTVTSVPGAISCVEGSAPLPRCPSAPLNLNTATTTQLDSLPGIGPAKAVAIQRYREEHGPFNAVEDLARVPGFGPAAVSRLQSRLTVR
jgi:competence ComEA-like helix-hairpin-helix protein